MDALRPVIAAASAASVLFLGGGPSRAQTSEAIDLPAAAVAPGRGLGMLEGAVKEVDSATRVLKVGLGPLGTPARTLEVNGHTEIQVEGRRGTLEDLHDGARIKASYEIREGKDVATRIEVVAGNECEPPVGVVRRDTTKEPAGEAGRRVASTQLLPGCVGSLTR